MAERDPFGRLPGENTLEGLGSIGDAIVPPSSEQALEAEPSDTDTTAARDAWRQPSPSRGGERTGFVDDRAPRTRGARPLTPTRAPRIVRGLVVGVFVVVAINLVSVVLTSQEPDSVQRSSEPAIATKVPDGRPPVGLQRGSLLLRGNLAPALRRLRTSGLGRLRTMRLSPERIDAQLLTRGGRLRFVQLRYDGDLRKLSLSGPGFGTLPTSAFSQVNAAAPARLARSAAGHSKRPVSQVNYLVFSNIITAGWSIYMQSGASFLGDARGTIIRRIG